MPEPGSEAIWLWLGTAGMFLGMLYFIARGWGETDSRRQKFYIATILITAIAFVNYLAMALGFGLTFIEFGGSEHPIYWRDTPTGCSRRRYCCMTSDCLQGQTATPSPRSSASTC